MKLIMENWREWLGGSTAAPEEEAEETTQEEEFQINHNLFVTFVKNQLIDNKNPKAVSYLKNYRGRPVDQKANKAMQRYKWDFPYDIDTEMDCKDKLLYLDRLVKSFYDHPDLYSVTKELPSVSEVTQGISPYRKCRGETAKEKDLRDTTSQEMQHFGGRAWYKKMQER